MKNNLRLKAWVLLYVFLYQIFSPAIVQALTSGPAQPEMASFEPYGTTELVDPFTGDFTYNIPLMDVEGYPINIAYNSGVTMEQEASWVGLGWNLNVGTVNRSVRGLPDDFKGDEIVSKRNIKDMIITTAGLGASLEILGLEKPPLKAVSGSASLSLIYNNYKGLGISRSISAGPTLDLGGLGFKPSIGMTMNSLEGTSFNTSLGLSLANDDFPMEFGGSFGSGYNTRTGKVQLSMGTTAGYSQEKTKTKNDEKITGKVGSSTSGSYSWMPVGLETFTPYPTFPMSSKTISFSASLGGEFSGFNASGKVFGSRTVQELISDTKESKSYGYLYSQNAGNKDLHDYNKPKQVQLNKTIQYLSPINYTYDVFSVSGQGVGGMFRPFRNDIGLLSDPNVSYKSSASSDFGVELGFGGFIKAGFDVNLSSTDVEYGKWAFSGSNRYKFTGKKINDLYENVYFKAAGELTQTDLNNFYANGGYEPVTFELSGFNATGKLKSSSGSTLNQLYPKSDEEREIRSKLFSFKTAVEAKFYGLDTVIYDYSGEFIDNELEINPIGRDDGGRKAHHISEIVQTNPDGERFVYGIPAYNWKKKEVTYAVANNNIKAEVIPYDGNDASTSNNRGVNNFYSSTETPSYAHSFLLTAKLSPDYRDATGDGVSDDDLGQAYKFNYTKTSDKYKWRIPYDSVSFQEGFLSENLDQKASYTYGEKELWYVHSIESKNQIAEFYISPREDGVGVKGEEGGMASIGPVNGSYPNQLYQLDSIILFQKYDRLKNKENAFPIKRVVFKYDNSLCDGVKNNHNDNGKLTLKSIEISYGHNYQGALSPYKFTYSNVNPGYNSSNVDRWGNYKPVSANPGTTGNFVPNKFYPYSAQDNRAGANNRASAWHLEKIVTPSGGTINIEYEADDYSYVQDQKAMQMYTVVGAGTNKKSTSASSSFLYNKTLLYIERPQGIDQDLESDKVKRLLFGGKDKLENMYFKFKTNIIGIEEEYVSGYVDAIDAGICSQDRAFMYIEIEDNSPNAISKAAWDYFRYNLMDELYDQPDINDNGLESIIKGLAANVGDIKRMFSGVENDLENRNVANLFNPNYSFIRLNNMTGFKVGGGTRVKSVHLNDNWMEMVGEGENAIYGHEYEYTTEENGRKISSGVASYEPMIGNDENPFRKPAPYLAAGKSGHIPAIDAYQETPFGESFFPSASVGYSKVTVKDINRDISRSAKAITVHEFYTAKDFPVIVKATELNPMASEPKGGGMSYPFSNQHNETNFVASQGFSILLNDMHGKPRSMVSYFYEEDQNGRLVEKPLSGTEYFYHTKSTPNGLMLDNEVEVLTREGKKENRLMGIEYDIAVGSSYSYQKMHSSANKLGTDVFLPGGLIPIPLAIPSVWRNTVTDVKRSKTLVTTKVIQSYGILKSVRNFTEQYSLMASNEMYDGQSGEVLLTKTTDEYNNTEYQFKMPAYWVETSKRMGPAFENIGAEVTLLPSEGLCNSDNSQYINPGFLKHGDKVAIYPTGKLDSTPTLAWVNLPDTAKDIEVNPCDTSFVFSSDYTDTKCLCHDTANTAVNINEDTVYFSNSGYDKKVIAFHLNETKYQILDSLTKVYIEKLRLFMPDSLIYPRLDTHLNRFVFDPTDDFCNQFYNNHVSMFTHDLSLDHPLYGDEVSSGVMMMRPPFAIDYPRQININSSGLTSYFDLTDTMPGYISNWYQPACNTSGGHELFDYTLNLDIDTSQIKYVENGQLLLVKKKQYYFLHYIADNPEESKVYSCIGSFTLIDRFGVEQTDLGPKAVIRVVHSGNSNSQLAVSNTVTSLDYPLKFDASGYLIGVKTQAEFPDFKMLQANYIEYSDEYEMLNTYFGKYGDPSKKLNKFLSESDSKFQVKNSFRYIASRALTSENVNLSNNGYYTDTPELWTIDNSNCSFEVIAPDFNTLNSPWFLNERVTKIHANGNALESKNGLDIYSAIQYGEDNKIQAIARNAKSREFLVEDFEGYYVILGSLRKKIIHNQLLQRGFNGWALLDEDPIKIAETAPVNEINEKLINLVKGVSHSGQYSLFLKGSNPTSSDSVIIEYMERSLDPVEAFELKNTLESKSNEIKLSYFNTSNKNLSDIKKEHPNFRIPYDPSNHAHVVKTEYEVKIHDSLLPQGTYYFSGWVRDMAHSGAPYKGLSPKIKVLFGSTVETICTVKKEIIDGWQQVEGKFSVVDTTIPIFIRMEGGLWGAFFDDIRIHPYNAQVVSYVHDPLSGRLKAQLDENNYATFYEYNDEGIPSQVKKETPAGVLTISETRQSLGKQ